MSAFQPYGGAVELDEATYQWSCYATRPIYEIRTLNPDLPQPPKGRKWVARRQHGQSGDRVAMMVDAATTEFSHMLAQISRRSTLAKSS
jgi:hypothetical protein